MSKTQVQRVVNAIQKFYPIALADKTWDNTGLLVDSSFEEATTTASPIKVLLTIDLTQAVAEEAINKNVKFIMAYHPFIFRGLKSISQQDPQQRSLLKLIQNRVSVYSPHTAVDSAQGGVNDYLVDVITKGSIVENKVPLEEDANYPNNGMGRLVTLQQPQLLSDLVNRVKSGLKLKHVQVAASNDKQEIKSIAICAGSGGGVFKGVKADLYFTGELSHHEALYFKECGSSVICCNHSNTERAFLAVIQQQLTQELEAGDEVVISDEDRDPFETW
ncbi:uncharacterized protein LODBEIA_P51470 [Lodderomyces beijingensis]|uniref:NGG1-interacting factor 3 n=1 Tax=Lodderomyces beijingensis TaxID=1775926 RepID=A0ABP0ZTA7_9ASCO